MDGLIWLASFWVDGVGLGQAPSWTLGFHQVERVNRHLRGRLVSYTRRGFQDHRIWSDSLGQKRDLLVYLPPNYNPEKSYPLAVFLHGAAQDEQYFMQGVVKSFDDAICGGKIPPVIVAAPDGSIHGRATLRDVASFWTDSKAGCFEQYLMGDVWNFLHRNYSIDPRRETVALMGVSMGGSAAMTLGIKHRDRIGNVISIMPLLNLRHVDDTGKYKAPFRPESHGLRVKPRLHEALGRRKLFTLRFSELFVPIFGRGEQAVEGMSRINPLEVMIRENLQPGELNIFVGYGAHDEFNVAAQAESFIYHAEQRGIEVTSVRDPRGRHDQSSGLRFFPSAINWAAPLIPR